MSHQADFYEIRIALKGTARSLDMIEKLKQFEEEHDLQSDIETIVIVTVIVGVMGFTSTIL